MFKVQFLIVDFEILLPSFYENPFYIVFFKFNYFLLQVLYFVNVKFVLKVQFFIVD